MIIPCVSIITLRHSLVLQSYGDTSVGASRWIISDASQKPLVLHVTGLSVPVAPAATFVVILTHNTYIP